jgi:hypothetical protein
MHGKTTIKMDFLLRNWKDAVRFIDWLSCTWCVPDIIEEKTVRHSNRPRPLLSNRLWTWFFFCLKPYKVYIMSNYTQQGPLSPQPVQNPPPFHLMQLDISLSCSKQPATGPVLGQRIWEHNLPIAGIQHVKLKLTFFL